MDHLHPIAVRRAFADCATCVTFDDRQELVWVGNQEGRLRSFVAHSLEPYTSYRAHHGAVAQLALDNRFSAGVISMSYNGVRLNNRRGISQWTISSFNKLSFMNLQAMTFTSPHPTHELLVAGSQPKMIFLSIDRGSVLREIDAETPDVSILRRNSTHVIVGTSSGQIRFKDPRTLFSVHSTTAHSEALSDIITYENYVLTSGYSSRQNSLYLDSFLKVYDVRTMRALAAIPNAAHLLALIPNSSKFLGVTHEGTIYRGNISDMSFIHVAQIEAQGFITSVDVSATGNLVAFTDAVGEVHMWTTVASEPHVNEVSDPVEVPSAAFRSEVTVTDRTPFSTIGMPYYVDRLFSGTWPSSLYAEVGQPAPEVDPALLAAAKFTEFVGYVPKPNHIRRNQVRYGQSMVLEDTNTLFLSARSKSAQKEAELNHGTTTAAITDDDDDSHEFGPPKSYRAVEIRYSKFGVEDFDFAYGCSLQEIPLEMSVILTKVPASLTKHNIQALYFTLDFRAIAESHCVEPCARDQCLMCETGFVFKLLKAGQGVNCRASNFLRAFTQIPQVPLSAAMALGLLDNEENNSIGSILVRLRASQQILYQLAQYRLLNPSLGLGLTSYSVAPDVRQLLHDQWMHLSWICNILLLVQNMATFSGLLESALGRDITTKAWCETCSKYQNTTQSRKIVALPHVLTITCAASVQNLPEVWQTKNAHIVSIAGDRNDSVKHGGRARFLPEKLKITYDVDHCSVIDLSNDTAQANGSDFSVEASTNLYEPIAVISEIRTRKEQPHLIAQIKVQPKPSNPTESEWYLFNDFLVRPIAFDDVIHFPEWKVPVIIQYRRISPIQSENDVMDTVPVSMDLHLLYSEGPSANSMSCLASSTIPLQREEIKSAQSWNEMLCAIDAEFVSLSEEEAEIRSDGTKHIMRPRRLSLARVSVLRGEGPKEGIPFIDDYIVATEFVQDYLTEYSGILAGDLDPETSLHHLVSLKTAYKKMRLLVDLGYKFIGHGLKQDFRIINILAPPEQILDTVDIYFIKSYQRKLSLRFLSWYILDTEIQRDMHDSVEDARTALLLYKRYIEFVAQGIWQEKLEEIYEVGRRYNFRPPLSEVTARPHAGVLSLTMSKSESLDNTSITKQNRY